MKIGAREVGPGHPCFIVAEVGLAHEGSVGMAHAFVDAIGRVLEVDAVKFQCHTGETPKDWRAEPLWCADASRADYLRRTAFSEPEWAVLASHAHDTDLEFLCSPFSVEAVELMNPFVPAWKIASGQVTNTPMLEAAAKTGKPAIISTGMLDIHAFFDTADRFREVAMLQATSVYPTGAKDVDLGRLKGMMKEIDRNQPYGRVKAGGLSDHSGTIYPGLAAAALGANILEVHVTMSRHAYGPDVSSSLTIEELRQLVEGVRFIERAMQPMSEEGRRAVERAREVYMVHA